MAIKIGIEPAGYYDSVGSNLTLISKNRVGAVFISRLEQHKKLVSIYPMDAGMAARIGADNASTNPREAADSAPKGASNRQRPYWYRGNPDNPATPGDDERDDMVPPGLVGTGKGSDVVINFSPENIKAKKVFDRSPHAVLFHELVHTLRIFHGLRNPVPTEKMKWMNEEEWLAVILTNIYMSAGGSTRLRGGYGDYDQKLEAPEDTSSGFLTSENTKLFDKLWPFWGPVFTDVGFVIVAPFNPIREYLRLRM
jgi:hypothetical protein